jgi:hypothetical protein
MFRLSRSSKLLAQSAQKFSFHSQKAACAPNASLGSFDGSFDGSLDGGFG